jgi:hypothetical protein
MREIEAALAEADAWLEMSGAKSYEPFLCVERAELVRLADDEGRRLLRAVEESVFSRGPNLFVCVSDFNHSGRRFYARNGYQQVGTIADLLIAGSSELLLRKTVHGPV